MLVKTNWPATASIFAVTVCALAMSCATAGAAAIDEPFTNFASGTSWTTVNNSVPIGAKSWFGGSGSGQDGADGGYAAANWEDVNNLGTISSWLISPLQTSIKSGEAWSFFTRKITTDDFADRIEFRVSTNGQCLPGTGATSTGSFSTLLSTVNPTLITGVYPTTWTKFQGVLANIPPGASGCFAFRYFVTNGGQNGTNSQYVGVDTVKVAPDTTPPAAPLLTGSIPLGPENNNRPVITGTGAEAESIVLLYDNPECTGINIGGASAADFNAVGANANVADDSTTVIHATATDPSGNTSACSTTSVRYVEQTHRSTGPVSSSGLALPKITRSPTFGKFFRVSRRGEVKFTGLSGTCVSGPCIVAGTLTAKVGKRNVLIATLSAAMLDGATVVPQFILSAPNRKLLRRKRRLTTQLAWSIASAKVQPQASGNETVRLLRPRK